MAAVIRLKRRVDEDPLDAFVLNCKRQRTTDSDQQHQDLLTTDDASSSSAADETSTVLKFAGTFPKADNIPTHLQQRLSKDEAREVISRVHRPKIATRNREASRQNAQNSRFRIVNCTRSLSQVEGGEGTTIVDVERDVIAAAAAAASVATTATEPASTATEPASTGAISSEPTSLNEKRPAEEGPLEDQGYVYDLYVVDDTQPQVHIPVIPDNLDDIRLVLVEDLYYTFFSYI